MKIKVLEKIFLLILLVYFGIIIYGLNDNYISYVETTPITLTIYIILSISLVLPTFYFGFKTEKARRQSSFKKGLIFIFVTAIFTYGSAIFINHGLLAFYTKKFGEKHVEEFTIARKSDTYRRRGCDARFYIKEYSSKFCADSKFISMINIGESVTFKGKATQFGFSINVIYINRRQ